MISEEGRGKEILDVISHSIFGELPGQLGLTAGLGVHGRMAIHGIILSGGVKL